jgi:hypothetical protein
MLLALLDALADLQYPGRLSELGPVLVITATHTAAVFVIAVIGRECVPTVGSGIVAHNQLTGILICVNITQGIYHGDGNEMA